MLVSFTAKHLWRQRCTELPLRHAMTREFAQAASVPRAIKTRAVPRLLAAENVDLASLSAPAIWPGTRQQGRGTELMKALRKGENSLVEVELGRYDSPGDFDRVTMRLGQYLDWLDQLCIPGNAQANKIDGRQLYLAQWRGSDEVDPLRAVTPPPAVLQPFLHGSLLDLYQTSFFIGANETVTPLHYDPYMNCFQLQAASDPTKHGKHVFLLPPSASSIVRSNPRTAIQRNTSSLDFHLRRNGSYTPDHDTIDVYVDSLGPEDVQSLSSAALSCVLLEGDTLFIPRGWWHRIENVALTPADGAADDYGGWTAGVAWWFLFR